MATTHVTANEEAWDAFAQLHGGGFLQSWDWAKFQEALGRTAYRFRIDVPSPEAGEAHADTVAQFSLIMHSLPFGKRYAYVPRGPVVGAGDREAMETVIGALRETMERRRAAFVRVEFPFEPSSAPFDADALARWGFVPVKSVQPADTVIVDLDADEPALLAAMHRKTRYNIGLADRHGVTLRESEYGNAHLFRHDVELFWNMLAATASRDRFHTHPKRYYETMLDVLSPKKRAGLAVRLVFAMHEGEAVAAALLADYGDTVTYLHGASASARRSVMAPHLLHWKNILEAKRRGFKHYDFWGVAPTDDPAHPWAGITRFKRGFGGRRVGYLGAWELPAGRFWYTLYRYAKRFRNI